MEGHNERKRQATESGFDAVIGERPHEEHRAGSGGELGEECNDGWNESCGVVFRARATTYATLTFLLLVTAWEVKHFKRSLFNIDPVRFPGRFSIFPALWSNQFLFWAVVAGFVLCFPIVFIPELNTEVFRHTMITWEWGIVFAPLGFGF